MYRRLLNQIFGHPFWFAILALSFFVSIGTGGYMWIEGWSFDDAIYMTVITMSTIGYGEIKPLSANGRIFTIGLIVVGVIIASYTITATIELFTSEEFLENIRNRRRQRALSKLSNHTIICGYGRLGNSLSHELKKEDSDVLVIDPKQEAIQRCAHDGFLSLLGSAADEEILNEAGIHRAKALVAAAQSDADNVFIVLTARGICPDLEIISRCNSATTIPKLEKAGANQVISPHMIAGRRMAQLLTRPNVVNFLDGILKFGDHEMRIEELIIDEKAPIVNMTLREAKLKVAVLAVDHPGKMVSTHPNADTKLLPGTALIAMGLDEELTKLEEMLGS
ncbi:MAG: potassium channel protein [Chloroflexota bacterium]